MPTKWKFEFEKDAPVYICGDKVKGNIELHFAKEKVIEDIRIQFRGIATVSWVDTMARFPKLYSGEELYMDDEIIVYEGGTLAPGIYNYKFLFNISDACPTTCTTEIGRIFYELSIIVEYGGKHKRKFMHEIMVLQTCDINTLPNALLPVAASDEIVFCCWPCASGPISVHFNASRGAYIPGTYIEFNIELANMSRRCKFRIHVTTYFMQIYKFTTEIPRRRTRYISYELNSKNNRIVVRSGDMEVWSDRFGIPPLPPSTQGTHIISIKYELNIEISINSVSQSMSNLILPIIIGTTDNDVAMLPSLTRRKSRRNVLQ